ncbi:MAG: hypothetical protein KDN22_27440 [Verrucomicrobiae bacterium]|nr:hypothetical protein [Verrucomicrobiae bacterium]
MFKAKIHVLKAIICTVTMAFSSALGAPPSQPLPRPEQGRINVEGKFSAKIEPAAPGAGSVRTVDRQEAEQGLRQQIAIRQVSDDVYELGALVLDRKERTITIPATVNMTEGMIEYALVSDSGKVHEPLFATAATPQQVHVAALLLGMMPERAEVSKDGGLMVPGKCRINVEVICRSGTARALGRDR